MISTTALTSSNEPWEVDPTRPAIQRVTHRFGLFSSGTTVGQPWPQVRQQVWERWREDGETFMRFHWHSGDQRTCIHCTERRD